MPEGTAARRTQHREKDRLFFVDLVQKYGIEECIDLLAVASDREAVRFLDVVLDPAPDSPRKSRSACHELAKIHGAAAEELREVMERLKRRRLIW